MLLPFALLGLIEISLRVMDVDSEHQNPFIDLPKQEEYVVFNPLFPARYFRTFSPSVSFDPFTAGQSGRDISNRRSWRVFDRRVSIFVQQCVCGNTERSVEAVCLRSAH